MPIDDGVTTYVVAYGGAEDWQNVEIRMDFINMGEISLTREQLADLVRDAVATDLSETVGLVKVETITTTGL